MPVLWTSCVLSTAGGTMDWSAEEGVVPGEVVYIDVQY